MSILSLTINLDGEGRSCKFCKKDLTDKDLEILIVIPVMDKILEFCSWYCLYKFIISLLKSKTADAMLRNTDVLKKLGLGRKWGSPPTARELTLLSRIQ